LIKYQARKVVVDPVMVSKSGFHLLQPEAVHALIENLLPLAYLLTPNIPEAEILASMNIGNQKEMEAAAVRIYHRGPRHVLIKGGHLPEASPDGALDILYDGERFYHFYAERIPTRNTHGTGCTLSAAIAANLAKGIELHQAIQQAKDYLTTAIRHSLTIGKGVGPTHHFYNLYQKAGMLNE
jgi:hydroxymethylpyrimidine/phosphomethylpyrimidine kinase